MKNQKEEAAVMIEDYLRVCGDLETAKQYAKMSLKFAKKTLKETHTKKDYAHFEKWYDVVDLHINNYDK